VGAGRHGDNVEWISFPSGVDHVFCCAAVVEEAGRHSIYVSQPQVTAELIKHAAQRATVAIPATV
jgi:hypothetical protein